MEERGDTANKTGGAPDEAKRVRELTMFLREAGLLVEEEGRPPVSEAQLYDEEDFTWRRIKEMGQLGNEEGRGHWERECARVKLQRMAEYPRNDNELMAASPNS